jgi:WD40 repeat protein
MSPDGRTALTGGKYGSLVWWNLETGRPIREFRNGNHELCGVAFAPDGTHAVSVSHGWRITYWTLATGEKVHTFDSSGSLHGAGFSPDGSLVAVGTSGGAILLWDVKTGQTRKTLAGHTDVVRMAVFTPDGKRLLSASYDQSVRLWDVESGEEKNKFLGHQATVLAVAVSPDGKTAVSSGEDKRLRVWDLDSGKELRTIGPLTEASWESPFYVSYSPDGKQILSEGAGPGPRIWDAATGEPVVTCRGHRTIVTGAAFTPDGKRILSGGHDRGVILWDAATGRMLSEDGGLRGEVSALEWSPAGRALLSQGIEGTLMLWNPVTGKLLRRTTEPPTTTPTALFSVDGRQLLVGGRGALGIRETATLERTQAYPNQGLVLGMALSPDGETLVTTAETKILWRDVANGAIRKTLEGHEKVVTCLAFSADGKTVVSGSEDTTVGVWDLETGTRRWTLATPFPVNSVAISPTGRFALSGGRGEMILWDLASGKDIRRVDAHKGLITGVAFSPDGGMGASAGWDRSVRLWDLRTGRLLKELKGHGGTVTRIAWSPGGTWLATGSTDSTILLWPADLVRESEGSAWAAAWKSMDERARTAERQDLLEKLESADPGVSGTARVRIASLGAGTVDLVLELWKAAAAGSTVEDGKLEPLLARLDDDNPELRRKATAELRSRGGRIRGWIDRKLRDPGALSLEVRAILKEVIADLGTDPGELDHGAAWRLYLLLLDRLPEEDARDGLRSLVERCPGEELQAKMRRTVMSFENSVAASRVLVHAAEESERREDWGAALNAATEALGIAGRAGLTAVAEQAQAIRSRAGEAKAEADASLQAQEALLRDPEDARANAIVGRYFCALRGDWTRGLRYLSRGDGEAVRAAAKKELDGGTEGKNPIERGELWKAAADGASDPKAKRAWQLRARDWYGRADLEGPAPELKGPRQRLKEIEDDLEVNLLKLVDPKVDAVVGGWTLDDGVLVCSQKAPGGRLQIPYMPPEEYDLLIVGARKEGTDSFNIGLCSGPRPFQVVIDGWAKDGVGYTSLWSIDGKDGTANETTYKGMLLENGRPSRILCSVRKGGVKVLVDGKVVIDWKGDFGRLTAHDQARLPNPRALGIGSYNCEVRYTRVALIPVKGEGRSLR